MAHLVRGCCALLLALLPISGSATWFGDNLGVHRVDSATQRIDLDLPSDPPLAIAVNGNDGSAWVLTQEDIVQYGRDGAMRFRATLGTLLPGLGASRLLALDPRDGGVWLGGERRLARLSASGAALVRLDVSATDLGVAQDGALWVLLQAELRRYAADGALIQSTPLSAADRQAKYLVLDDTGGALWLAGEKRLAKRSLSDPSQVLLALYRQLLSSGNSRSAGM